MVTAMVFTLDEEVNLPHCLSSLSWCDDVIVVDSFSTDRTVEIAERAGARVIRHAFTGFGDQRNWALAAAGARHDWVLILDADERVPAELAREILERSASTSEAVGAYRVRRRFHMWGRWLRYSSLYPTWVVRLVHRDRVRYVNRGHAETQEVEGSIEELSHDLIDENRKGIDDWFDRQNRYARKEALYEIQQEGLPWRWSDLVSSDVLERRALMKRFASRLPFRASLYFAYTYILRGGFLDGSDGLVFCLMRATYQRMIQIKKYDLRRARRPEFRKSGPS